MRIPRIYYPDVLSENTEFDVGGPLSQRLLRVLRVKIGYQLILFNDAAEQYVAEVVACTRKTLTLKTHAAQWVGQPDSPLNIHLFQGLSKHDKMDWVIQKACELGVASITSFVSDYTDSRKKPLLYSKEHPKYIHWQKILIHACEQCGRTRLPTLNPTIVLSDLLSIESKPNRVLEGDTYFLSPRANVLKGSLAVPHHMKINVLIGPEGGFSQAEEKKFIVLGIMPIKLGPRILRTETAPIVVCSLFQYLWGDLDQDFC